MKQEVECAKGIYRDQIESCKLKFVSVTRQDFGVENELGRKIGERTGRELDPRGTSAIGSIVFLEDLQTSPKGPVIAFYTPMHLFLPPSLKL